MEVKEITDKLYQEAIDMQDEFYYLLKKVADRTQGQMVKAGLKDRKKIEWKVTQLKAGHYNNHLNIDNRITDVLRGALVYENKGQCYLAIVKLKDCFDVKYIGDYFKKPKENMYRAIHSIVLLSNKSYGEVQIHQKEIYNAKCIADSLYKERQKLEAEVKRLTIEERNIFNKIKL